MKSSLVLLPKRNLKLVEKLSSKTIKKMDIIVVTDQDFGYNRDVQKKVQQIVSSIDHSKYTVHHLSENELLKQPWQKNSKLVVLTCASMPKSAESVLIDFKSRGGEVLNIYKDAVVSRTTAREQPNETQFSHSFLEAFEKLGLLPNCQVSRPKHTNGVLMGTLHTHFDTIPAALKANNNFQITLRNEQDIKESSSEHLVYQNATKCSEFDFNTFCDKFSFFSSLLSAENQANKLIPLVMHTKVLDSTMNVTRAFCHGDLHNVICVADVQLQGKGRRSNTWISNEGCAMMSFSLGLTSSTDSGKNKLLTECPSTIQILAAMAVVQGMRSLAPKNLQLPVCIKWPNDIYVQRAFPMKIGGVLVNGEFCGSERAKFLIGIGLNLDNEKPTVSINQTLAELDAQADKIGREQLLASIYAHFLSLVNYAERYGFDSNMISQYCSLWIHSEQKIHFFERDQSDVCTAEEHLVKREGVIKTVDSQGFLIVETDTTSKELISLHPDGNSFDLTQNLVYPVARKFK